MIINVNIFEIFIALIIFAVLLSKTYIYGL